MKKISKKEFFAKVECFLGGVSFNEIYDLKIPADKASLLLYNTEDLWLSRAQFDALTALLPNEKMLYIAQNDSDEVYELGVREQYEEYERLNLFSLSFISSENFDWAIVIDEGVEAGTGFLVSSAEFAERYASEYGECLKDMYDLIEFHYRDAARNPNSIENLTKILSLAQPFLRG